MQRGEQSLKCIAFTVSFILQIASLFVASYLADILWGLFFVPVLFAAVISAIVYYKAHIRSMWSYLWLNFGAVAVYTMVNKLLSSGTTPPNDVPQLLIVAIIFMALMATVPIIPVCLFYRKIVGKNQK
jgi:hypothetical protein